MKFVTCVKLTPDTEQLAAVKPDKVGTGDLGVTMVLNPWDEYAVEEALLLAERYDGDTVAITLGTEDSVEALKRAVAMGIGETVFLCDDAFAGSDAWGTAYALAAAKALLEHTEMTAADIAREALKIAGDLCIYTNDRITVCVVGETQAETQADLESRPAQA